MELIERQAAIDALARMMPRSYTPDGSHPADEEIFRAQEVFADCIEVLEILPSAQPEEIGYEQCANAMMKMWIDEVVTDGEYNRIMDKLNKHWRGKQDGKST